MAETKKDKFSINTEEMTRVGLHFGHRTSRINPKMKPYISGVRNTIHIIDVEKTKEKLVEAASGQSFIAQAPLVVVGCTDEKISNYYGERGGNLYSICDVSASIQNLMLSAHSEGLGSVWIGSFDEKEVSKILNLPKNLRPVAIVPVGYPAEKPSPPPRVSKEEAIEFIK